MVSDHTSSSVDFDTILTVYERLVEPLTLPAAVRSLDLTGIAPGAHVVAAGTGALAVVAASRGARVVATDIAPAMIARAADRLQRFEGCEARVMSFECRDLVRGFPGYRALTQPELDQLSVAFSAAVARHAGRPGRSGSRPHEGMYRYRDLAARRAVSLTLRQGRCTSRTTERLTVSADLRLAIRHHFALQLGRWNTR
jgi:hypothetical protein